MIGHFEWRIPEGHNAITHVLVDGTLLVENDLSHRRQESVDELGQTLGAVLLGKSGEAAYITEQDGHFSNLPAQAQTVRFQSQLFHECGGEIATKCVADSFSFTLSQKVNPQRLCQVDQKNNQPEINGVDKRILLRIHNPRAAKSAADCSDGQLSRVIERLKEKGFKPLPKAGRKAATHPMARKARALWISLHHLCVVQNPSEQALEAFAHRQLKCEKLSWANQRDANKLIEALKAMAVRNGWRQTAAHDGHKLSPKELQMHLCEVILAKLKDGAHVPADWYLDIAAKRLCGIDTGATEQGYSADDYGRLAKALGDKLRGLANPVPEA